MASTSIAPVVHTVFPDEIWEDIFLRLDAAADLARASAACSSFRRIVSARQFLRRFQSTHSPPVLGFIRTEVQRPQFVPVEPPHRSAREARALEQAADFTFSFLPDPSTWRALDARDGRVLLGRSISTKTQFLDFLVCDPLHRRYVEIPRIPDHLMAATDNAMRWHVQPVLAPAGETDEEESFRVIGAVHLKDKVLVFVFSSCNQTWTVITSTICLPNGPFEYKTYYAHGCLYWMFSGNGYSLMLDTTDMEFSIIELPPHNFQSARAIVEAEEGRLRFICIADGTNDLYCKNWQSNGVGAQEVQHDKLIPLPGDSGINCYWEIDGIAGHYLALGAYPGICNVSFLDSESLNFEYVLDMKTWLVQKLCTWNNEMLDITVFPYARFPPPLALPSI